MDVIFSTAISSLQHEIKEWLLRAAALQQELERQISKTKGDLEELNRSFQAGRHDDNLAMRDIRDVGYRFENLLEALIIHTGYSPGRQSRKCIVKGFCKAWSTANKFNTINSEIEVLKIRDNIPRDYNYVERNRSNDQFVGRVEEMERLLVYLCSDREINDQVITISGMAGIGKTALASKLFKHPKVVSHYTYRAWVNVSRKFETRKILEMILEKLKEQGCSQVQLSSLESMANQELVSTIQLYLETKMILIVLDGICSVNDWESFSAVLSKINNNGDCRSKILITTRMNEVAESSALHRSRGAARWVHLTRLTEDEGCELLANNIPGILIDKKREDLVESIVNFCGGLPSTIITFLKSMNTKHNLEEWEEMATILMLNSTSSKRLEPEEQQKALGVLASARHTLQPFFLYMGVLQEDLRVEIEKFYLLSMADGTLRPLQRGGEKILDIAQSCVTEVAQRNLVDLDEGEEPTITRFKYCHLNGFMRDLSLLMNKDEGFFKVVDFARGSQVVTDLSSSRSRSRRIFHVAINLDEYEDGYDFPIEKVDMMHVRVLLFSAKKIRLWPKELSGLLKLKFLRVLDFNGFNFKPTGLPKGIERAVHLRYLSFRDCILPKLPTSIANLPCLCVLDLRVQCSTEMIIPNVLWKMKKLKHLYFPLSFRIDDAGKVRLDGLTELETITNFNAAMFNVKDLFGMPNLQYLDSHVVGNVDDMERIIEHIIERMRMHSDADLLRTSVEIKKFDCYTEERESVFRKLLACPSLVALSIQGYIRTLLYNEISHNLIKIVLTGSEMMGDPMKTLEKLPKLRLLVLDNAFGGKEIVCSASGFVELKVLKILNLKFLQKWIVEKGAMPRLSTLAIANCGQLEMLPKGLQFVGSLREVKVSQMPVEFIGRVQMVQSTYQVIYN